MIRSVLLIICIAHGAFAQKHVQHFFDGAKKYVQEDYYVLKDNEEILQGPYKRYYPNGQLEMEGVYDDGRRSGTFV